MSGRSSIVRVLLPTAVVALALPGGGNLAGADTTQGAIDVAFLGDSYTYGTGATTRAHAYAYRVAAAERWTADIVGLPGSGYVRVADRDRERIAAGIPAVLAAHPKLVIVECGRNDADRGIPLRQVKPRALRDLGRLRAGLPGVTIVVLGPVWLSGHPSRRVLAVRAAVRSAQLKVPNTVWIDPIAQRWFTGRLSTRTGDDATMINYRVAHPDDRGYRNMAVRLEADLKAHKIH